jgi:hypothetical protein
VKTCFCTDAIARGISIARFQTGMMMEKTGVVIGAPGVPLFFFRNQA